VHLARSRYLPQAYAFGEYNLNRGNALPVEPDWIVGVGVRYTFLSNIDRARTLNAAREREQAAAQTERETRKLVAMETSRAWDLVDTARQSFLLLDGNIKAAEENLRVQDISFREGEGTVADVIDAQAALATARTERIAAAYEYDVALAALLAATNRSDEFATHLARGDRLVAP
jgi:outer membrane protein TolC